MVTLQPPDWRLTEEALRAAISAKTRALILNSPLNPIGRVFDTEELEALEAALSGSRAIAICDEVYEHLVFVRARFRP